MDGTEDKATSSLSVDDALKMYEEYKSYWSDIYREAIIDLKMSIGDRATHWGDGWDDSFKSADGTYIVCNELPQFIHQVTNDIRQNTPSIHVIPEEDGDEETADVFADIVRGIEYKSSADAAYDTAAEYAVKCSLGFARVDHDYCYDDSDEQELLIKSIADPLICWLDPSHLECDGRDANGAILLEPISKKEFNRLYKGKSFISFTDPKNTDVKDTITIAEIFIREAIGKRGKNYIVRRYKFSGEEMLAETTFPGKFIPIVPFYGEVTWVDGKRNISSLIRQARDPQRRLNHWARKESQILAMAPIAPVQAVEGTLVNERRQWQNPGSENVLEWRQTDLEGNPAPPPSRLQPPPIPTGIINAMQGAKENIKESMGLYNASIGQKSNETSGVAINARKVEGDVATFHFPDNTRRSINHIGNICVYAAPEIYDTPRKVLTVNNEAEPKMVGINGDKVEGQEKSYSLIEGKYHVRVTTGASYTTRRQEAAALFSEVIKQQPQLMQIIGDLWAKNLDVAGAEAMAARIKKTIPPQLLDEEDQPAHDPEKIQMGQKLQEMQQIIQQGAQEIQQLQSQLQNKQGEMQLKSQELQLKSAELQQPNGDPIDVAKLQLQKEKDDRDYELKQRELALKEAEFQLKASQQVQETQPIQPMGIKLDTTGFQMMKTPEQNALEAEQASQEAQIEQEELRLKQIDIQQRAEQANALIGTLGGIANRLDLLAVQSAKPITVLRDESGAITGAQ